MLIRNHAAEAEKFAARGIDGDGYDHDDRMRLLAYAQVHAQLAVADAIRNAALDRQEVGS